MQPEFHNHQKKFPHMITPLPAICRQWCTLNFLPFMTISHLRFRPRPIRSAYLIKRAGFVACHRFEFLEKYDVLKYAAPGAFFLLNAHYAAGRRTHLQCFLYVAA